jgi:glycosyltransferase involved in cell wall biosynthesis
MPVYNAQDTVGAALDCLCAQTLADLEILVVDDGSRDASVLEVEARQARDGRVRLLRLPHGGVVKAINAGQACSDSAFVARMDADDLCAPQRLARQLEFLEQHDLDLCDCLVALRETPGLTGEGMRQYIAWLNSLTAPGAMRAAILQESPMVQPAMLARRSILQQVGPYEEGPFPEDYQLWLRLAAAGARFGKLPEQLFTWSDPPGRLTRSDARYRRDGFVRLRAQYLTAIFPAAALGVVLWGAGRDGRALARELLAQGVVLRAFVDVDGAKVGRQCLDLPVEPYQHLPALLGGGGLALIAVGIPRARQEIRAHLQGLGLREGQHFVFAV